MTPWTDEQVRARTRWILDSYRHWSGGELVAAPFDDDATRVRALFDAPFAVLAHDAQDDPLCIYANAAALQAFELRPEDAATFRTRETAEPGARAERGRALARAERSGLVRDYEGVRVSTTGRRFRLANGRIWTVRDDDGRHVGQAAAFDPRPL